MGLVGRAKGCLLDPSISVAAGSKTALVGPTEFDPDARIAKAGFDSPSPGTVFFETEEQAVVVGVGITDGWLISGVAGTGGCWVLGSSGGRDRGYSSLTRERVGGAFPRSIESFLGEGGGRTLALEVHLGAVV